MAICGLLITYLGLPRLRSILSRSADSASPKPGHGRTRHHLAIIQIAKTPAAVGGWVELVITLIGCVPAVDDALKIGFKLMKQGHNFGRDGKLERT